MISNDLRAVPAPIEDERGARRSTLPPPSGTRQRRQVEDTQSASTTALAPNAAARRIVDALVARGVTTFFGIPGGPVCPIFEALRSCKDARLIQSRHESHAAFSAASYYRATGKVPAVVVTAGPGITNAVSGVASAFTERIPMVVIGGDVAWATHGGRLAQDSGPEGLRVEQLLAPITRAQIRVIHPRATVSQTVAAWDAATDALNPGPALLIVPLDRATAPAPAVEIYEPQQAYTLRAPKALLEKTVEWIAEARRPLLVIGAGCREHAVWLRHLVDVLDVPFVTTPRAKGLVSELHPRSLRNGGMAASLWARRYTSEPVDVALVLGTDLDDTSMGPTPYVGVGGRLIHVDINSAVFNRNVPTALGINADVGHFAKDLYEVVVRAGGRNGHARQLIQEVRAESPFDVAGFRQEDCDPITPHRAIADLELAAGKSARFITDIGEHMLFALHYLTAEGPDEFQIQLNLGSMGSGIAGATGLALADPSRRVVCICGDGGMQMAGMEVLTSLKERLPVVYAVFNDSRYNMVHHGMKQIFGDADPYDTLPVDFAAWARSMNIPSAIITQSGQITRGLLDDLQMEGGPTILDIRIDKDVRIRGGGRVEALQHMSMLASAAGEER